MPQYEVIRLGGKVPVHAPEFGVLSAPTLPEGLDPKAYAVRPARDPDWRKRERNRFRDGTYKKPPWDKYILEALEHVCPDHFLHVSLKDPSKVSFTETAKKGEIDRQSAPMSAGRYLQRYARNRSWGSSGPVPAETDPPFLDAAMIRQLNAQMLPVDALKIGSTADDFEYVYKHGPNSCMSGETRMFDSSIHPVRIYAAGDLQIAYLEPEKELVSARVLIWPERKVYGRMYGDEHRLENLLQQLGYKRGDLTGAKLLRVVEGDHFVAPYIDYHYHMEDRGDHCVISEHGIRCDDTRGFAVRGSECSHCGDFYDDDEISEFEGDSWCEGCLDTNTMYCAGFDERRRDHEEWGYVIGVGTVCEEYFETYCYQCEKTGNAYLSEHYPPVEMADGSSWSPQAFADHGGTCERTDEHHPNEDLVRLEDTLEYVSREWADENAYEKDGEFFADDPEPLAEAA